MGEQFLRAEHQVETPRLDVKALAQRLDRQDMLLLKEFYHTGMPAPDDTASHVLRLLADRLGRGPGPLSKLSYSAIRRRLENLHDLGLVGKVPRTNPAIYFPHEALAPQVRLTIALFAADLVGISGRPPGGAP